MFHEAQTAEDDIELLDALMKPARKTKTIEAAWEKSPSAWSLVEAFNQLRIRNSNIFNVRCKVP